MSRKCCQERELLEESEAPLIRGRIQGLEEAMMGGCISLLECITNYHNLGTGTKNSGSWKSEINLRNGLSIYMYGGQLH